MRMSALNPIRKTQLQVAILAAGPERLAYLSGIVVRIGHCVVAADAAEVLLCDGQAPRTIKPIVFLGNGTGDYAGVLQRNATEAQIEAALKAVAAGLHVRSAGATQAEFEELTEQTQAVLLTPRELQVLVAIGDGLSNKAIARRLSISQHTVKFHVESLFRKLGVRTRAEAVARGLEQRKRDIVEF
jgi:DNA-binding NarL/FixJ family response regulator